MSLGGMTDAEFEAGLDAYQARLYEEAEQAADRSYLTAARIDPEPLEVTFGELRPGDFMTNEGPEGRWVEIIDTRGPFCYVRSRQQARIADDEVSILFEIPEPVHISGETRYWIEAKRADPILIDAKARA